MNTLVRDRDLVLGTYSHGDWIKSPRGAAPSSMAAAIPRSIGMESG